MTQLWTHTILALTETWNQINHHSICLKGIFLTCCMCQTLSTTSVLLLFMQAGGVWRPRPRHTIIHGRSEEDWIQLKARWRLLNKTTHKTYFADHWNHVNHYKRAFIQAKKMFGIECIMSTEFFTYDNWVHNRQKITMYPVTFSTMKISVIVNMRYLNFLKSSNKSSKHDIFLYAIYKDK